MNIINIVIHLTAIIIGYAFILWALVRTVVYLNDRYINNNRIARW